jgi:dienelactone hydrolase
MKTELLFAAVLTFGCGGRHSASGSGSFPPSKQVQFSTADGRTVFAELYSATAEKNAPLLMLFHQAGSNAKEYAPLTSEWTKNGFKCLAVNLRSGGDMWDADNPTAAQYRRDPGYLAAYQDMEAAMNWALRQRFDRIAVVGSSYSASLVFHLADQFTQISLVAAFSPGEYGEMKGSVGAWMSAVRCPVLVACAASEEADVRPLFKNVREPDIPGASNVFVVFDPGAHGASAMRDDKDPECAKQYREAFLRTILRWKNGWK